MNLIDLIFAVVVTIMHAWWLYKMCTHSEPSYYSAIGAIAHTTLIIGGGMLYLFLGTTGAETWYLSSILVLIIFFKTTLTMKVSV
jgi:hypothetical protein